MQYMTRILGTACHAVIPAGPPPPPNTAAIEQQPPALKRGAVDPRKQWVPGVVPGLEGIQPSAGHGWTPGVIASDPPPT